MHWRDAPRQNRLKLRLTGQQMWVMNEDGNPLPRLRAVSELLIGPGSRREVLVRGLPPGARIMTALPFAQFPGGDKPDLASKNGGPTPDQTVFTVVSSGTRAGQARPRGVLAHPADLRREQVNRRRTSTFSENPNASGGFDFRINGELFDHMRTPIAMRKDDVEEWRLVNTSSEWHTFHIHVNPFQVISVDGLRKSAIDYEDNVAMPPCRIVKNPPDPADPACAEPSVVVIRMRPTDFTGRFVSHCHITNHEDRGMMMAVRVA